MNIKHVKKIKKKHKKYESRKNNGVPEKVFIKLLISDRKSLQRATLDEQIKKNKPSMTSSIKTRDRPKSPNPGLTEVLNRGHYVGKSCPDNALPR